MSIELTQSQQVAFEAATDIIGSEFKHYAIIAINDDYTAAQSASKISYKGLCIHLTDLIKEFAEVNNTTAIKLHRHLTESVEDHLCDMGED